MVDLQALENELVSAVRQIFAAHQEPNQPVETLNNVLVGFAGEMPSDQYFDALKSYCIGQDAWFAMQGFKARRWSVTRIAMPGKPKAYNFISLIHDLIDMGAVTLNGLNAHYIWAAHPDMAIFGTMGGDVWGQIGGRHGNRQPGVSGADADFIHCLATGRPLNPQRTLPPNWAMGAAAHETGHQFLLPCADADHGPDCIMERWWDWPNATYETDGWVWSDDAPNHRVRGNERQWLLDSGFFVPV